MKDFISTTYTFTPGASGVGTVNLSGIQNFDIKRLVAIINQTRGVTIYATGSTTTGYTNLTGSTLTLSVDTTGQNSADILQVVYNDPDLISSNASLTGTSETLTLTLNGHANTTFQLSGTWVGTVQFEASNNGADWTPIFAFKAGDNVTPSSTATTNDIYRCTTAGFSGVRAIVTAYTSGTIVVTANATINTSGVFLNFPLPVGSNLIGAVNTSQINGTAIATGAGDSSAGTQRVILANENVQDLYVIGQSAQTATVNNILTATAGANGTDVLSYRAFTCQVISTGTGGTFIFEGTNVSPTAVSTSWNTLLVRNQALATGATQNGAITASVSNITYTGDCNFRYIRLRIVTTITGGSIQAFTTFTQTPYASTQTVVSQATAGNLNMTVGSGTLTTLTTLANGQTAHSSASTGSPLRVGGRVKTAVDTTLVAGDASDIATTTDQSLVIRPFAVPELDWSYTALSGGITNTTDVVLAAAGGTSIRRYITGITIQNASATVATEVVLKDGATVIWRGYVGTQTLLNSVVGINFLTPLKTSANTALNFACITTGSQVYVNAQGFNAV